MKTVKKIFANTRETTEVRIWPTLRRDLCLSGDQTAETRRQQRDALIVAGGHSFYRVQKLDEIQGLGEGVEGAQLLREIQIVVPTCPTAA